MVLDDRLGYVHPENPDAKIWRYMDLAKFVALLKDGHLWFSHLTSLEDRFEGAIGRLNVEPPFEMLEFSRGWYRDPSDRQLMKNILIGVYVNCWHLNEHESAAMWKLYAQSGQGVAVRSTFAKLRDSFPPPTKSTSALSDNALGVAAGLVRYIDYETEMIDESSSFGASMTKRKSFAHEQELRAAVIRFTPGRDGHLIHSAGMPYPCDLHTLIERVYLAPGTPGWVGAVVRSLLDVYGFADVPAINSALDDQPVY